MSEKTIHSYFEKVKHKLNNIKKNHEIEFSFDTVRMNVSLEQFKNLMLTYKKRAEVKKYTLLLENTLDISYKYDLNSLNSYRVSISGLEQINNFISKFTIQDRYNNVILIDALTSILNNTPNFTIIEKKKK